MPNFEKYIWNGMERFSCPAPCHFNYETEAEVQACFDGCARHPKPVKRLSEIVGPKGEDVIVIEQPEEAKPSAWDFFKRSKNSDATGEP